jgi:predicted lysophospholipase L1 biosynthesis ABC-type transport system permease subunit
MINETLASRFFSGRDPIGRGIRLRRGSAAVWHIVGVVANVKNFEAIEQEEPQVYVPLAQAPQRAATVVVRASGGLEAVAASMRSAVAAIDPAEPIADLATMDERIERVTAPFQIISVFVTFFGAVTLLLAGVGVYGVVAYLFAQRTREIGLRMALGARRADVAALVLRQLQRYVIGGIVPGLALAWLMGQAMKAILFGITPDHWLPYVAMTFVLTLVMVIAVAIPARRAAAIDPTVALRYE